MGRKIGERCEENEAQKHQDKESESGGGFHEGTPRGEDIVRGARGNVTVITRKELAEKRGALRSELF